MIFIDPDAEDLASLEAEEPVETDEHDGLELKNRRLTVLDNSMAEIRRIVDRENDLSIIKITGVLREGDLIEALAEHFSDDPTLNSIYDSSEGDWSQNSNEYYMDMIRSGRSFAREGARTAFVFASPVDFGIGRMLENHCEDLGYKNRFACFYTLNEALSWLSLPKHQGSEIMHSGEKPNVE